MNGRRWRAAAFVLGVLLLAGCGGAPEPQNAARTGWVEDDVSFVEPTSGMTLRGTYRHEAGAAAGPAALLISESGNTDRNGDNAVAGPVGTMRQLAELLSAHGVSSLRYDKVGTGRTGLGPYALRPRDVGSAVYTAGARAALRYLAGLPGSAADRLSVYGLGEGAVHALRLATDPQTTTGAPRVHALGLLQPLAGRYLDVITARVRTGIDADVRAGAKTPAQGDAVLRAWQAAVDEARTRGTVPATLPEGLGAILNPGNVKAVVETDALDPVGLARALPPTTKVLLSCSDVDQQARCDAEDALIAALGPTTPTVVRLRGVNHVLRDDPTDSVANYAKPGPLSAPLVSALAGFAGAPG